MRPAAYSFSSKSTVRGKKLMPGRTPLSIVAVAKMTVSPQRTVTAPPACWARMPVSMLTSLSPNVVV